MKQHTDNDQKISDTSSKLTHAEVDLTRSSPDHIDKELRQPHERDESPNAGPDRSTVNPPPRQVIEQAASDVKQGLKDTERRGTPSDVPTRDTPANPEGQAPAAGIDRYSTASHQDQMNRQADAEQVKVRNAPEPGKAS